MRKWLAVAVFALAASFLLGSKVHADTPPPGFATGPSYWSSTPSRTLCNTTSRLDFNISVQNMRWVNTTTGEVEYDLRLAWERCDSRTSGAFALYGSDVCPLSGYYGESASGRAYDCLKYVGNPPYHDNYALSCDRGTNGQCVTSVFNAIRVNQDQPTGGVGATHYDTIANQRRTIPNWNTRNNSSGNYAVVNAGDVCAYFKLGNTETYQSNVRCQSVTIRFTWTVPLPVATIRPAIDAASMPADVAIGTPVAPHFRIMNDSGSGTAATTTDYTRRLWLSDDNSGTFGPGDTDIYPAYSPSSNVAVPTSDVDLGTPWTTTANATRYICASLTLSNPNPANTNVISNPAWRCTRVGKYPSFSVNAGDLRTGGAYYGAGANCQMQRPGTINTNALFAQYFGVTSHNYSGVTAATPYHGNVTRGIFSTGSIYNTTSNTPTAGDSRGTSLNFARGAGATPAPGGGQTTALGGQFHGGETEMLAAGTSFNTHCLTNVFRANRYPASTSTVSVAATSTQALPAPVAGTRAITYAVCGDAANRVLTLNAPSGNTLNLTAGQRYVVRVVPGAAAACRANPVTVVLNTNVTYSGVATAETLPQFVLLAGDTVTSRVQIKVAPGVTRLDGIYANASQDQNIESFLTCNDKVAKGVTNQITQNQCNNRLVVNGAVILGGRLSPYRTAGHDTAADTTPAEVFNLRPDVLMSDAFRGGSASLNDISQREVAPRY